MKPKFFYNIKFLQFNQLFLSFYLLFKVNGSDDLYTTVRVIKTHPSSNLNVSLCAFSLLCLICHLYTSKLVGKECLKNSLLYTLKKMLFSPHPRLCIHTTYIRKVRQCLPFHLYSLVR